MSASITNPGTIAASSSPNDTTAFVNGLLATPWQNWTIAEVQALHEYTKRLPSGSVPGATVGTVIGVTPNGTPSVTGAQTVQGTYSPALKPSVLSAIFAQAPQTTTIAQIGQLLDATHRVAGGSNPNALLGSVIK